jgi:putative nucleotidyltransferase with HDIG domain
LVERLGALNANAKVELRSTETMRFAEKINKKNVETIGTYSTFPEVNWAVIAQRTLAEARTDAGFGELNQQALTFVSVVVMIAIVVGYFFAVAISQPIRGLAASTRAISRGEFHQRTVVRGASEISELAENFNKMAGDIEEYIEKLKEAAEANRELFLGSIRMLAAAIDEKDPYTRGHSGRVAKYSTLIARELGMSDEDLDRLRIAALLHDVGKARVPAEVLNKTGKLDEQEWKIIQAHPWYGALTLFGMRGYEEIPYRSILVAHEHHMKTDLTGYPKVVRPRTLGIFSRIVAVADGFDAATSGVVLSCPMRRELRLPVGEAKLA